MGAASAGGKMMKAGMGPIHTADGQFHGNAANNDHMFYVYPKSHKIHKSNYWDTHLNPNEYCTNHVKNRNGYRCLGHPSKNKVPMDTASSKQVEDLAPMNSNNLIAWMQGDGRNHGGLLPEYQTAANRICVAPELMRSSHLGNCLHFLDEHMRSKQGPTAFENTVLAVVRKAFGAPDDAAARRLSATVPGLASGNMFQGAMQLHKSLQWERPYLTQALLLLHGSEDPDGLQIVLGLMRRGADECQARKIFAFSSIVRRVHIPNSEWMHKSSTASDFARRSVMELVSEVVEDVKDKAFRTTFLEPTKMYFRATRDGIMEGDVDVHGASTYLAILLATLGVQLSRRPFLHDEVKGVADFLTADLGSALPVLWACENFGQDWEALRSLRSQRLVAKRRVPCSGSFVFEGATPGDVAIAAVNRNGSAAKRLQLAQYLERFAAWFAPEFLLPRLISRLTGDEGRLEALQTLMDELLVQEPALAADEAEKDVRYWLWDMSVFPAAFRVDRAACLLHYVGALNAAAPAQAAGLVQGKT